MQIVPTTTAELANHLYNEIMPGVYACPESGRLVIVNADESALLMIVEQPAQQ